MTTTLLQQMIKMLQPKTSYRVKNTFFYEYDEFTYVAMVDEQTFETTIQTVRNDDLEEMTWKRLGTYDEVICERN